jgi:hypothetical protein
MVTELQFAAVAAYLLWCLVSCLSGMLGSDGVDADEPTEIGECDKNDKIATAS